MKTTVISLAGAALLASGAVAATPAAERQLAHMVYFKLKESTPANKEKLVSACQEYLDGHPGTVYFSAGVLAEEMQRDVNDRNFDVALHLVFSSKAAHDAYAVHPRHQKFIEEWKPLWDHVRVFDSYLAPARERPSQRERAGDRPRRPERDERTERLPLPDPAAGFAGMIRGQVKAKREGKIVVQVADVVKTWEHNRAPDAKTLIGKPVMVVGKSPATVARFLGLLEVGETVELDVAHREGEALTVLELTAEQRARVEKAK